MLLEITKIAFLKMFVCIQFICKKGHAEKTSSGGTTTNTVIHQHSSCIVQVDGCFTTVKSSTTTEGGGRLQQKRIPSCFGLHAMDLCPFPFEECVVAFLLVKLNHPNPHQTSIAMDGTHHLNANSRMQSVLLEDSASKTMLKLT